MKKRNVFSACLMGIALGVFGCAISLPAKVEVEGALRPRQERRLIRIAKKKLKTDETFQVQSKANGFDFDRFEWKVRDGGEYWDVYCIRNITPYSSDVYTTSEGKIYQASILMSFTKKGFNLKDFELWHAFYKIAKIPQDNSNKILGEADKAIKNPEAYIKIYGSNVPISANDWVPDVVFELAWNPDVWMVKMLSREPCYAGEYCSLTVFLRKSDYKLLHIAFFPFLEKK